MGHSFDMLTFDFLLKLLQPITGLFFEVEIPVMVRTFIKTKSKKIVFDKEPDQKSWKRLWSMLQLVSILRELLIYVGFLIKSPIVVFGVQRVNPNAKICVASS